MLKLIICLLFIHLINFAIGQNQVKKFVEQTAVSISTIDPDSTNFSDLEVIGNAIGNSQIVMLGEQDHGDAPTFLAKTRLIKYLHEKKGFNVLAFESDFFGLNYGIENLSNEKNAIDTFLKKNIFPIWTACNTCRNLFYNYIPSTHKSSNPLRVTGFDNQMILDYSRKYLSLKLDSVLRNLDLPITKQSDYVSIVLPAIDSLKLYWTNPGDDYYRRCDEYLKEIKSEIGNKLNKNNFWVMVIDNLIQENLEYSTKKDFKKSGNARDLQMANNLKWLVEYKYPFDKIIVWAANEHIAKYADSSKTNPDDKMITMSSYFTRDSSLLEKSYIIGFTSYEGEAGRLGMKTFKIRKPKPDGFENWINKSFNYAFVDFKIYNGNSEEFYLKGLGHNTFFKKDWTKIFDGIFYIKEMYACER
jgi:erythromycin esterase-like protein